jgi:hypothetical protein
MYVENFRSIERYSANCHFLTRMTLKMTFSTFGMRLDSICNLVIHKEACLLSST